MPNNKVRHYRTVWLVAWFVTMFFTTTILIGNNSINSFQNSKVQSFHHLMHDAMIVMNQRMERAPMTGDPDHDFAAMMIPHHEGAIDMAKLELLYGKDPALRRLAQEIIVTQQQEVQVMQMRLKQLKTR
ncbi:MAG: DUF305 domain-containing protein [Nitrospirota bacterium]